MATHTLVTKNNLTAIAYSQSPLVLLPADLATIDTAVLGDPNVLNGQSTARSGYWPGGGIGYTGILVIPNRGYLKVLPGDVVAVDVNGTTNVGWPILVSADAIANGSWTFT